MSDDVRSQLETLKKQKSWKNDLEQRLAVVRETLRNRSYERSVLANRLEKTRLYLKISKTLRLQQILCRLFTDYHIQIEQYYQKFDTMALRYQELDQEVASLETEQRELVAQLKANSTLDAEYNRTFTAKEQQLIQTNPMLDQAIRTLDQRIREVQAKQLLVKNTANTNDQVISGLDSIVYMLSTAQKLVDTALYEEYRSSAISEAQASIPVYRRLKRELDRLVGMALITVDIASVDNIGTHFNPLFVGDPRALIMDNAPITIITHAKVLKIKLMTVYDVLKERKKDLANEVNTLQQQRATLILES